MSLASRMILDLLERMAPEGVNRLKTTITADNEASWALFKSIARKRDASFESGPFFERDRHFGGEHDTEHLVTIGPFNGS